MSTTTATASAMPASTGGDVMPPGTAKRCETSFHTKPMAHVQNTGFHSMRTVAAAAAPVMRGRGSAGTISRRQRPSDTAAATGRTATEHRARATSGSSAKRTLSTTESRADSGMNTAVRDAPSEAKNCCHST